MFVSDCMRTQVYTVPVGSTLRDAMQIMGQHMVGTIPVLNDEQQIAGVVLLDDLLTQFMPHFVQVLRSVDFVHDYGALGTGPKSPELAHKPIESIMRPPYFLLDTSGLMEAMVFMHNHDVNDVPVVNEAGHLVGLVSRGRVGSLFLLDWLNNVHDQPEKDE